MFKPSNKRKKHGFGLAEIIVAAAIISGSLYALLLVSQNFLNLSRQTTHHVKAEYLLEEGLEAIRVIRDRGWTDEIVPLETVTTYYLDFDGITWQASTTASSIDNFYTRTFTVEDVYRDANDDIASSGTLDSDTRKFNLSVFWTNQRGTTTAKRVSTYYTNFFND